MVILARRPLKIFALIGERKKIELGIFFPLNQTIGYSYPLWCNPSDASF